MRYEDLNESNKIGTAIVSDGYSGKSIEVTVHQIPGEVWHKHITGCYRASITQSPITESLIQCQVCLDQLRDQVDQLSNQPGTLDTLRKALALHDALRSLATEHTTKN